VKRLNTAVKCTIKFEKRRTWEKWVLDLQEDYKGNKKLLHEVKQNKTQSQKLNYTAYQTEMESWFGQKTLILRHGWNISWGY
jgi:ribosomal protein S17E